MGTEPGPPPSWHLILDQTNVDFAKKSSFLVDFQLNVRVSGNVDEAVAQLLSIKLLSRLHVNGLLWSRGAMLLADQLAHLPHLVSLNLARTGLALQQEPDQPDGISALAGKLQHAPHLTELCLADNNMTASGARALLQQGSTCLSRLTLLDLSHNYERGPHGMVGTVGPAIKYLKDCPQLTELNLTCCTLLATGHVRLGK